MPTAVVVHRSVTGTTRRYAEAIAAHLRTLGVEARACSIADCDASEIAQVDLVLLGCWTEGWFVVHQHPDAPWVSFARDLPDLSGARVGLFDLQARGRVDVRAHARTDRAVRRVGTLSSRRATGSSASATAGRSRRGWAPCPRQVTGAVPTWATGRRRGRRRGRRTARLTQRTRTRSPGLILSGCARNGSFSGKAFSMTRNAGRSPWVPSRSARRWPTACRPP
jgi:flavodoxin